MQGNGKNEEKKNISVAKEDDRNKRWKLRLIVDHNNYASREQISRRHSALDLNHTDEIALIATSFLWHISKTLR